ncbi:MAG: penicillin-binding transpeptidase domain-containing protein, partial [Acidimicrobiia bacterium]|nr:penicillin-binding transpeptidase domain-containing protein [Acidimicrobiia bacterium]
GGGGGGLRSLEDATIFSVNTVFCQVSIATGAENIVKMAHRLGIESDIEAVPSVVLGSQAVTPLEMASAYSTFANFGARVPSYLVERIEDADGNVIYQHEVEREQVIDRALAASIVRTLQQAVERGTGTRAQIDRPQAGKTGTHQNSTDVWFMGFIPQLTTAVWVGYPDSQIPIRNITIRGNYYSPAYGGTLAAPIWKEFMEIATDGLPVVDFPEDPEGMEPYYAVPKTVVPSISGLGVSGARAAIRQAGLRASTVTVYGDAAKGTLLSMSPGPGTRLNQGATVTLRVAGGPPPSTAMPSFLGLTQDGVLASIAQVLSDSGVVIYPTFTTREVTDPSQIGIVVAQAPGPGTVLPYQVWPTFVMGVAPGG